MKDLLLEQRKALYGDQLGETFHYLLNEWCSLWITYKQYINLFGVNKQRVDLINSSAGSFFYNVERIYWQSCVLAVCRLTDPVKSMGKDNLTINRLPALVPTSFEKMDELTMLVNEAVHTASFHRERRNKTIGHSDFMVATGRATFENQATRKKMQDAIFSIHKPLQQISLEIGDTDTRPHVIDSHLNEISLLYDLYVAKREAKNYQKKCMDLAIKNGVKIDAYPSWLQETNPLGDY